eukprot:8860892-Alexandrium_andersonii.AAC.1
MIGTNRASFAFRKFPLGGSAPGSPPAASGGGAAPPTTTKCTRPWHNCPHRSSEVGHVCQPGGRRAPWRSTELPKCEAVPRLGLSDVRACRKPPCA